MRPWPVVIEVHGKDYEIPAMPATDWLCYLLRDEPDLEGILFELVPECENLLYRGDLDLDDLEDICLDIITTVSARPWWVAIRLVMVMKQSWNSIGARSILKGIDPNVLSLSAWLDAVFLLILEGLEPREANNFSTRLEVPPAEIMTESIDEMEMSQASFLALGAD